MQFLLQRIIQLLTQGANLTINKAAWTVTANSSQSKTYGVNDPTLTYTSTGLVNATVDGVALNDTGSVTGSLSRASYGTLAGEQVGTFAINIGSLAATSNYNAPTFTSANFTINKAALGINATAASKIYGVNDPTLSYTSTGLVSGTVDGVALNDTISGSLSRTSFGTLAGEQVGTFAINQGTVAVSAPTNYTTTYTGANLTINKAALGINATAASKTYGTTDPTLAYTSTGLVSGTVDGVTLNDTISGSLARTSFGTLAGEQVGTFAINQGSVAVSAPTNYTTTYTGANLTINKASWTVTANAQSKTYGINDPTLTYSSTGLVNATVDGVVLNDTGSVTGSLSRASFGTLAGEQVGTFAISLGTLATTSNYNAPTYTGANLTINKAALGINATAASKIYGVNDPTLAYTSTGLVNATVDGVALNDTISGSLSRTSFGTLAGEQVGTFAINQGSVAVSAPTNYTTTYTGANLTINKAALGINATVAKSKTYGVADPTLDIYFNWFSQRNC